MHFAQDDLLARDAMVRELMRPIAEYMDIDGATEVCINRPGEIFVEVGPEWRKYEAPNLTLDQCLSLSQAIATYTDQEIGAHKPILSAMLPDGERVQIVVPPAVEQDTVSLSIRKPSEGIRTLDQYEADGAFGRYLWARSADLDARRKDLDKVEDLLVGHLESNRLREFLELAVRAKKNVAVVGDTGSGKTTLMKSVCQSIPPAERLITIEDVRELFLPKHTNRVHLLYSKGGQGVAKVTPSDLIASNMRMKPDRVLLAELRGGEAFDFLKLLTTGHSGSITSYHAESCALAAERYVFMCKEHDQASIYDADALKRLVSLTIDVIVHVVAENIYDDNGDPVRKDRYVAEVHYDPVEKLRARFGNAEVHRNTQSDSDAREDALTGLMNRRPLMERLERAIARGERSEKGLAVFSVDLHAFREIRREHGDEVGDLALKAFAKLLLASVRKTDTVARLGADEFVVIAEGVNHGKQDACLVAQKIIKALEAPLLATDEAIHASTHIGVTVLAEGYEKPEALLSKAQAAMGIARASGQNTFHCEGME